MQKKFTAQALHDNKKVNTVQPPLCSTLLATYNCKCTCVKSFSFLYFKQDTTLHSFYLDNGVAHWNELGLGESLLNIQALEI